MTNKKQGYNPFAKNEETNDASYQALYEIARRAIQTNINTKEELFDAIFCVKAKILLNLPKPEVLEQIFEYIENIFDEQEEDYREEYWAYHTKRMEKIDALKD